MRPASSALRALAIAGALLAAVAYATACAATRYPISGSGDLRLVAQLLAAVDAQQLDGGLLDRALASPSAAVRRLGALAVGQSRTRALAPRLRPLLADADSGVAANAAFAAGLLVDTGALRALAVAIDRGGPVAREAAWSLGEIGEPARAAITAALDQPTVGTHQAPIVAQLLLASAKLRPVPVAAIVPHAADPHSLIREAAAYALGRPRAAAGVRTLLALATDSSANTRASVARGLARSAAGDSLGSAARAVLRRLVADPSPHVRIAAIRSVATYPGAGRRLGFRVGRDIDANARVAAAELAGDLHGVGTAAEWTALWEADSALAFRRALLVSGRAHARLHARTASWAEDSSWRRRAGAAAAVDPPTLLTLVRDRDARVRTAAYGVLAGRLDSAASPASLRTSVLAGLRDPDPIVRSVVIDGLASQPRAAEVPVIRAAYLDAAADRDSDARLASLRYLAKVWRTDSLAIARADQEWLRHLAAPVDPLERAAAGVLPAVARWTATAPALHPLSWYERVANARFGRGLVDTRPQLVLTTARGPIIIELYASDAPLTVHNFVTLVERNYFTGTRFHRVVPAFVAQDGDPRGDGNGGPGYAIRDEHNRRRYGRGAVGMALAGPNTGGSQFFITLAPQPHLDGHYTVFGRVLDGFAAVDAIVHGDAILSMRVRP